jgi:3'(2'), 5'-bisphosphate nucleotidase
MVLLQDFGIVNKSDDSPLTKADTAANKVICEGLERLCPHIPIISEETKQRPYEMRQKYEYCWIVDPLDGTKEFVKRNGEFTVMIALVQVGEMGQANDST